MADPISALGASLSIGALARFIPEPRSKLSDSFNNFLQGGASLLGKTAGAVMDLAPDYKALLEKQMYVQQQMQVLSMESNVEKSKHETSMAVVRNLRVG